MTSLFYITSILRSNYKNIYFCSNSKYNYNLSKILENHNQAYCYKLYISEKYITENFKDQQNNKILKINNSNKQIFRCFNYKEKYNNEDNHKFPYPLYKPCSELLLNNFVGIDATGYSKEDSNESFCKEGLLWDIDKINIKLELFDYIKRSPTYPF